MSITLKGTTGIDAPAVTLPEGSVQSQLDTKLDDADALAWFESYGKSLTSSGYQKLPSGLILQWGSFGGIPGQGVYTFNYPIAFPYALLSGSLTMADQSGGAFPYVIFLNDNSTSSVGVTTFFGQGSGTEYFICRYIVLGY